MTGEPHNGDDPRNINIAESEGSQDIAAPKMSTDKVHQPLKIRKVNLGMVEDPKFTTVRDYWDEATMAKITDLLHKFQDLFPTKFAEMKGILGDFGEMKMSLNPNAKPLASKATSLSIESVIQGESEI